MSTKTGCLISAFCNRLQIISCLAEYYMYTNSRDWSQVMGYELMNINQFLSARLHKYQVKLKLQV